jgi:peptidoglycan/LPS O-acetylase OafA/YrhL
MGAYSNFLNRFKRITGSGSYMPEIDGLRFIAVFLIAFMMHIGNLLLPAQLGVSSRGSHIYQLVLWEAGYGVQLFFMISGFILALPFAKEKLLNQKKVNLKDYYWRRVTRIEPLYIITLALYFAMRVYLLHYDTFMGLLPNFLASIFYVHNIVYNSASAINGVAWSLEVEVQFYLLAPLLTQIYRLKNTVVRRGILIGFIIFSTLIFSKNQFVNPIVLIDKINFFLCGMLLTDLYLLRKKENNGVLIALLAGIVFFMYLFIPTIEHVSNYLSLLKIFAVTTLFYTAITNNQVKKVLSFKIITVIGGMCYSIYLLHMGIYGIMRHKFFNIHLFSNITINIIFLYCLSVIIVLVISSLFFLLIEKPTMKKNWYKKRVKIAAAPHL